jgi:hypothetical protein
VLNHEEYRTLPVQEKGRHRKFNHNSLDTKQDFVTLSFFHNQHAFLIEVKKTIKMTSSTAKGLLKNNCLYIKIKLKLIKFTQQRAAVFSVYTHIFMLFLAA